jgi:hypothetical protein
MATSTAIRYREAGDRAPRVGADHGTSASALTTGDVTDADVVVVAVPPAGVSAPNSPHVAAVVYRGTPGETFDVKTKCTLWETSTEGQTIRNASSGPLGWSFHYVVQAHASRTL